MVGRLSYRWHRRDDGTPAGGYPLPADASAPGHTGTGEPDPLGARLPAPRSAGARARRAARYAGSRAGRAHRSARVGLAALTDRLIETAPRIPVRDRAALRRDFPGLGSEEIADRLVSAAAKSSAAVGAGVGAAAAAPVPPAMTLELAAETLAVAAVEIKLIAELHELYDLRPPGTAAQRASAYVGSWANRRGVDVLARSSLTSALNSPLKRELRQRLLKRTLHNLPSVAPFLVGAAIGGVVNQRDTRRLAQLIRADLRRHAVQRAVPGQRSPDSADSPRPDPRELPGPDPVDP